MKTTTIAAAMFIALAFQASAEPIDPADIRVVDGDTIQVYHVQPNVRLVGFNAPETQGAKRGALKTNAMPVPRERVGNSSGSHTGIHENCPKVKNALIPAANRFLKAATPIGGATPKSALEAMAGIARTPPINITQNTTFASLNTLGSLITAFVTVANDDWRNRFLKAATPIGGATPKSTLEAMAGIARTPWANPNALYALFDEAYPQPADGSRRKAPFLPYLAYAPPDFALMLSFAGGGVYAPGKFMFDPNGNLWSGVNWMPGSQSGVTHNIGGGTIKFAPNGIALSPPVTGFTGMGVDGVGWGTGVTLDNVWVTSFNGSVGVMDFDGRPIGKETDFPLAGKVGGLQGVDVAANGDVWIADATKNQMLHFPGGLGLTSPQAA